MSAPILQAATLSVPNTASTTTYGTPFQFVVPGVVDYVVLLAQLKGLTGGVLDVSIQESWDFGTTWDDVAHFTQLVAASSVNWRLVVGAQRGLATATVVGTLSTAVPVLAQTTYADGPWAAQLRLVATSGSGTSGAAAVQTLNWIPVLKIR